MTDLWMPGAEIHDLGDHAPTDQQYPPKAIAHITFDHDTTAANPVDWAPFEDLVSYFTGEGSGMAPHIIWDPFNGRFAQMFPADSRSKSVRDLSGGTRTNRAGRVVIQIEAVFFPYCRYNGQVYAKLTDTPCAGWDRLHAWISSLGVPDVWPMGHPRDFSSNRDEGVWETQGGWYAHAQVPENDHIDPGSWPEFPSGGGTPAPVPPTQEQHPARYQVTIDGLTYGYGANGDQVTRVGRALVAKGFGGHYQVGPGPDWSDADTLNYAEYQKSLGYSGASADGIPGPDSLHHLLAPTYEPFPGADFFHQGQHSDIITRMGQRLVQEGCSHYRVGPGPDWSSADQASYAAWQRKLGYSGGAADGIPGPSSWAKLQVPAA